MRNRLVLEVVTLIALLKWCFKLSSFLSLGLRNCGFRVLRSLAEFFFLVKEGVFLFQTVEVGEDHEVEYEGEEG